MINLESEFLYDKCNLVHKGPCNLEKINNRFDRYNLIIPFTLFFDSTIEMINNPIYLDRNVYSYHIDRKIEFKMEGSPLQKNILNTNEIYDELKSKTRMRKFFKTTVSANNLNMVEDIHQYLFMFYNSIKNQNIKILIDNLINFLVDYINDKRFDTYINKYLIIDLDIMKSDLEKYVTTYRDGEKLPSIIDLILRGLYLKFLEKNNNPIKGFKMIFTKNGRFILPHGDYLYDFRKFEKLLFRLEDFGSNKYEDPESVIESNKNDKKEIIYDGINSILKRSKNPLFAASGMTDSKLIDIKEDIIDKEVDDNPNDEPNDILEKIKNNPEFLNKLDDSISTSKLPDTYRNKTRNEKLKEKSKSIKIGDKTLEEIINIDDDSISEIDISDKIKTPFSSFSKFKNIHKDYNEKGLRKDIVSVFQSLSSDNKSIKCHILDMKVENTSDELDKKETWTVKYEDELRQRHTIKVDLPIFVDDCFLFLGGSKKNMNNQKIYLPVVKTNSNESQITTNYNKIFVRRFGQKASPKIDMFMKFINDLSIRGLKINRGINFKNNEKYITDLEFNAIASKITSIETINHKFFFNPDVLLNEANTNKDSLEESIIREIIFDSSKLGIPVGISKKDKYILISDMMEHKLYKLPYDKKINNKLYVSDDIEKDRILLEKDLIDLILEDIFIMKPSLENEFNSIKPGNKHAYTRCKIMGKEVPLVLLISFLMGFTPLLNKMKIDYELSDTRKVLKGKDKFEKEIIKFKDCYLIYNRYPLENSLLLNGLSALTRKSVGLDISEYNLEELNSRETYIDIFEKLFDRANIFQAFINFQELLMDPITLDICKKTNLPEDMIDMILYTNNLLVENSSGKPEYRIRNNEIIPSILYDELSKEYGRYRIARNNGSKNTTMSIKQKSVIIRLLTLQTVEEYSGLNPITEGEKRLAVSPKGHSGINVDEALTLDKRKFEKEDLGVFSIISPPTGKVGTIRQLTWNPNITSTRGFVKKCDDPEKLNEANLYGVAESMNVLTRHDEPMRNAMTWTQFKHLVPTSKMDYNTLVNGAEQSLPYYLSNDFVYKSSDKGKVIEIDEDTQTMIVEYSNKNKEVIDLKNKIVKNAGGGHYLSYNLTPMLKKGDKFDKMDILAYNPKFFKPSSMLGLVAMSGRMTQIAIGNTVTFEDSCIATQKYCDELATELCMKGTCLLDAKSNIASIVSVGDNITVGEPLVVFENNTDDPELNKYLAKLRTEASEEILALGKNMVKSKYTGVIEDIKIYRTVELDQLSDSLKKLCKKYESDIKKRKKSIEVFSGDINKTNIQFDPDHKIETYDGKVKGYTVGDGILIEFQIKYYDRLAIGDKVTKYSALKNIVSDIIPRGQEPFPESDPDSHIDTFLGNISLLSRKTPSILIIGGVNKLNYKLTDKILDMYFEE